MSNVDNQSNIHFGNNPYIVGVPIDNPENLIGREKLFNFIKNNLDNNSKIILLHGLRRIGKSSVLKLFDHFISDDNLVCINFDLQNKSTKSVNGILYDLAQYIVEELELKDVYLPEQQECDSQENWFSNKFLPEIYKQLGNKKVILLLDEFDVAEKTKDDGVLKKTSAFFSYLKTLINNQERLFLIPVIGRNVGELDIILRLYHGAPNQEIGLLDPLGSEKLVTKPAQKSLIYEKQAIDEIYKICAGHPFLTQAICSEIFRQARENSNRKVTRDDVTAIIDRAIESAEGGLDWFWKGVSPSQQVIFSAAAEAQNRARDSVPNKGPIEILKEHGVIQTEELIKAVEELIQNKSLDKNGQVKVELVRLWITKKHPIKQEIKELEHLKLEEIQPHLEKAIKFTENGQNNDALLEYQEVFKINPNHYPSLLKLAQGNLKNKNFDKAIELYERAYKFDPEANKQRFIDAIEDYGNDLILQQKISQAKAQFQLILDYDEENISAQEKIKQIDARQFPANYSQISENSNNGTNLKNNEREKQKLPWRNLSLVTAGIVTILGIGGLVGNRWLTSCHEAEEKMQFGLYCLPIANNNFNKNISSGESILFSDISSASNNYRMSRQKGVEAYKNKEYATASEYFKNAREANINDPEVLIYQNNALARKDGNSFILAVVVPVNNAQSIAQEILRGVAQAQKQFNDDGGYQGRLLEIVIANDADNPEEAKKIAKQLAEKTEILGIIGHYSSRSTKKALEEYTQAKLPIISPTSTSIELKNDVFFRTVSSDAVFGKKLADYTYKSGLNEVIILYDSESTYSRSLMDMFKQEFKERNGKVAEIIDFSNPGQNIKTKLLDSLSQNKAKGVLLFPDLKHTRLSLQLAQDEDLKMRNLQFLGGDTLYSQEASRAEGLIVAVPWFRQTQESTKFATEALGLWGNEVSWRTATSFDATQAFIKTFKTFSPNVSRSDILSSLRQINIPANKTAGYILKFDSDGETMSKPILVRAKGGNFTEIQESRP
ncbi:MAG: ABC transporter substrate-binding protein [Nostoc sp. ChiSLP02]|nr:ABC transporter substrate-binding protein [Nostoc sp. DedSLP01]MDZ8183939.1 ABC transporter substrate-binding protein [Nostoc sp. ChiSLP02]